ncbi:MAG: carbamate kinase [candidate division WOR-3 bacterium]
MPSGKKLPVSEEQPRKAVVALGGNALRNKGESFEIEVQARRAEESVAPILRLLDSGYRVVITHGNGPQVGLSFLRNAMTEDEFPVYPMDALNAETQGWIGYAIERGLRNQRPDLRVATLVSMVEVSPDDPGFANPSKPIGEFFDKIKAMAMHGRYGWPIKEDAGRGWRVVVPSPLPIRVLSAPAVNILLEQGFVVIAAGGGGIPVINRNGRWEGAFAVIDKDRASATLAREINAELLIILTAVDSVYLNFGKPDQRELREITCAEAEKYLMEGHFPSGSMGPKIEAACDFLRSGGKEVIITSLEGLRLALEGKGGTRIVP